MTSSLLLAPLVVAAIVAWLHVYIFYMESIKWGTKRVNRAFNVSEADAQTMKAMAFNQGFYNLFLAIAIFVGIYLMYTERIMQGQTLVDYAVASVAAAGIILWLSRPQTWKGAAIQAAPAILYFILRIAL